MVSRKVIYKVSMKSTACSVTKPLTTDHVHFNQLQARKKFSMQRRVSLRLAWVMVKTDLGSFCLQHIRQTVLQRAGSKTHMENVDEETEVKLAQVSTAAQRATIPTLRSSYFCLTLLSLRAVPRLLHERGRIHCAGVNR